MKVDILAIGAHPDDVELGCSATLSLEISRGKKVAIVDLTRGELGTRGSAQIRSEEAARAAEILGVSQRENLDLADGFFQNDQESRMKLIRVIRKYQPEIVLCNAIDDRHIDHARGSQLASDACFLSGLRRIETIDKTGEQQSAWRPKQVYHYIQWKNLEPDVVVDVGEHIHTKVAAVKAYSSQFFDKNSSDPKTPISSQNFLDSITYRARDLGRLIGVDYAEGYTVERYPAVDSLFDLK